MRVFRSCFVVLMYLGFGHAASAQNQPCDVVVNTGERNCIYQVVGQDSCPVPLDSNGDPISGCPENTVCQLFYNEEEEDILNYCVDADESAQLEGYESSQTTATAPKWSSPPPGVSGKASTISSAVACGAYYKCTCSEEDPITEESHCLQTQCGFAILWTLTPIDNVGCIIVTPNEN